MIDKILASIIVLSGMFFYHIPLMQSGYYLSQRVIFIVSCVALGSYFIYRKNKWLGLIGFLSCFSVFNTFILRRAPLINLYDDIIYGICIMAVYYFARRLRLKQDTLKWFMIPALLNAVVMIIQYFDHYKLAFVPFSRCGEPIGFLGNPSVSACFLAITVPIFVKYNRRALAIVLLAIFLSKSFVAIFAALIAYLFMLRHKKKSVFIFNIVIVSALLILGGFHYRDNIKSDFRQRLSMYAGTLDGLKHNPIFGWGVGSFEPTMSKVKPEDSSYFGWRFNSEGSIMNHPHNELLYGWWSLGIIYPILLILLFKDLIKRFVKDNLLPFSIMFSGFICMMLYFLNPPHWLLFMMAFGIYDNCKIQIEGGC